MKKIVVAPDSFKGSLTSAEVADAVERGIKDVFPQCNVVKAGVADGGEGTVEAIVKAVGGDMYAASVTDPLGRPIKAAYGIVRSGGVKTAVMEMSAASGLPLLLPDELNPWITSTYGTGEMISDALNRGCRKFLIGIGGSATNDAGTGMLSALGVRFLDSRRTANAAEQSNVEVNTAKWARLPNLNASAGQNWNWGRTQTAIKDESTGDYSTVYVNTGSHGTNMSVSTSIPLFTGLEIPNQYALAKLNLKAALADLEKAKEDISINIASAYLQVLFNEELHRVSLGQVELSKEQCNRIERLAEVGQASPAEVAEAKARVAQDEMNAVQTGNNYQLALLDLSQLIELETPEGFLLENPAATIELIPLASPDEIYQLALGCKASIQAAQYRLEGSKHSIRIAQSGYYPQLTLSGSLGTNYYSTINRTFSQQMSDNFNKYIGFNLSVPIFNRLATRNRVRTARLQRENYSLQLDNAKKDLYKEIQQAWYNAAASESKYTSSSAAASASEASFKLMSEKYENGKANAVEYNEAKQNLMKAQSDELQAKYEYLFRTKILDFYKGEPIE